MSLAVFEIVRRFPESASGSGVALADSGLVWKLCSVKCNPLAHCLRDSEPTLVVNSLNDRDLVAAVDGEGFYRVRLISRGGKHRDRIGTAVDAGGCNLGAWRLGGFNQRKYDRIRRMEYDTKMNVVTP